MAFLENLVELKSKQKLEDETVFMSPSKISVSVSEWVFQSFNLPYASTFR